MEVPSGPKRSLKSDDRPLYTQAIEALRELLGDGQHKPGDLLPTEGTLAKQLGISRSTLREALGHLETHGLITRRQGVGTFVAVPVASGIVSGLERLESFRSTAALAGLDTQVAEREVGIVPATPELAAPLGLEPGAELIRVQVVEAINGLRTAYLDTYMRVEFADVHELAAYQGSALEYLAERARAPVSYARSEVFAIDADKHVATKLEIPVGKAVLHLEEICYSSSGEPTATLRPYFLTDRFRFYFIRRVPRGG